MKSQHQVVLSIGTNQGNRLENIERCLQIIHHEVATVVKVSELYETPSWGFDSDAFYNAAIVVHTFDSAATILSKILYNFFLEFLGKSTQNLTFYIDF